MVFFKKDKVIYEPSYRICVTEYCEDVKFYSPQYSVDNGVKWFPLGVNGVYHYETYNEAYNKIIVCYKIGDNKQKISYININLK